MEEDKEPELMAIEEWEEEEYEDEGLQERMFLYATAMDEDVKDKDWVPDSLRAEALRCKKRQMNNFILFN
jgi:hypothetical protein